MKRLINQLKRDEGFRNKPYFCTAGKLTIGYGRNLDDKGISEDEAEIMLVNDLRSARTDCELVFPNFDCYVKARQYALINMMFNLGLSRFLGFKKMIRAIKEDNWVEASVQALDSQWAEQVGSRAERIALALKTGEFDDRQ